VVDTEDEKKQETGDADGRLCRRCSAAGGRLSNDSAGYRFGVGFQRAFNSSLVQ